MVIEDVFPTGKPTRPQLELLRMFSKQYPDNVWVEVKDLLSRYFMDKATQEMDAFFDENKLRKEEIRAWSTEHMRTPYNKEKDGRLTI